MSRGNLSFVGNSVPSGAGGALYIQEFGQVKLVPGTQLEFINNVGRYRNEMCILCYYVQCLVPRIGSAIVVDVQTSSSVFSELVYNPQCFLIYDNTTQRPTNWRDVRPDQEP